MFTFSVLTLFTIPFASTISPSVRGSLMMRRRAALHYIAPAATSALGLGASRPQRAAAFAGDGTMSREEVLRAAEKLTPFQKAISLSAMTERPFAGKTTNGFGHDNKQPGTYVGAISGQLLFESSAKYESGTGWPSFFEAVPGGVLEREDPQDRADPARARMMGGVRIEVIDASSGAHLGHVFPDGPPPTGKRYCMNAGAMTFVPAARR
jgi:peptide-methionine (R)-S-oxide reductase